MIDSAQVDYYAILGVRVDATESEIRKAYKKLALKLHPDKQKAEDRDKANEEFTTMSNAYQVLGDQAKRQIYDMMRQARASNANTTTKPPQPSTPRDNSQQRTGPESSSYYNGGFHHQQQPGTQPGHHGNSNQRTGYQSSYYGGFHQQQQPGGQPGHHGNSRQRAGAQSSYYYGGGFHQQQRPGDQSGYHHAGSSRQYQNSSSSSYAQHQGRGKSTRNNNERGNSHQQRSQPEWRSSSQQQRNSSSSHRGTSNQTRADKEHAQSPRQDERSSNQQQQRQRTSSHTGAESRNNTKSQHSQSRVFGVSQNGLPCQRCIQHGRYCYQHTSQDPKKGQSSSDPKTGQSSSKQDPKKKSQSSSSKVYGLRQDGQPCQRCIKQCGFCYQHASQDPEKKAGQGQRRPKDNAKSKAGGRVYGTRIDGQPCKRCLKKGGYCHQHLFQQRGAH